MENLIKELMICLELTSFTTFIIWRCQKRIFNWKRVLVVIVIPVVTMTIIKAISGILLGYPIWIQILFDVLYFLLLFIMYNRLLPIPKSKLLSQIALASFFSVLIWTIFQKEVFGNAILFLIGAFIVKCAAIVLLERIKFISEFKAVSESKYFNYGFAAGTLLVSAGSTLVEEYLSPVNKGIICVSLFLGLWWTLLFFHMLMFAKEKHTLQEVAFLQQRNHTQKAESMCEEIIVTKREAEGLTDTKSEQNNRVEYISETLQKLQLQLESEVQENRYFDMIHIWDLKNLLLSKMTYMMSREIEAHLIVHEPVRTCSMQMDDFLQCLNILLDNAIESAMDAPYKIIDIALKEDRDVLTVSIKNTYKDSETPDINRIRKGGFSTKSKTRGIGLSNYYKIVRQYGKLAEISCDMADKKVIQKLCVYHKR